MPRPPKPLRLKEGMHLAGRYKLVRLIGKGAMAEVWAAQDRPSSSVVAVKVISELMALSEQARKRFEREMQVIGSIHNDHVVSLLGHGQVEDGRPFLVMELVTGDTLAMYLERQGRIGPRSAAAVAGQVLEGLEAAHEIGIVHRDLKPANICLAVLSSGKRRVKILDFGVAHLLEHATPGPDARLTSTGAVLGSPRYMSLEVARGLRNIDGRSDIFSVGAMMYHALAGEPPFSGKGLGEILNRIYKHDVRPLGELRPELPARLVRCVERAMAPQPDQRYGSAVQMRLEVEAIREGLAGTPGADAGGDVG